jgi:hypothetical protein
VSFSPRRSRHHWAGALSAPSQQLELHLNDELVRRRDEDPVYADRRNFYKVEKWSRDGLRVELMILAGSNLEKARRVFNRVVKYRPRIRLTLRQRMRILDSGRGTKRSLNR